MQSPSRQSFIVYCRIVLLLFTTVTAFPGMTVTPVKAGVLGTGGSTSTTELTSHYRWNVHDDALPLITLPDHLDGNLDLSLTYSLGEYQLPLFQTLYFNQTAGNYILLLMMSETRQMQFVVLESVNEDGEFHARGGSSFRLVDKGDSKVLSASDGSAYTFSRFADGELHCSRIHDSDRIDLKLEYSDAANIQSITDGTGRNINFSYTDQYLSSVTQTWGVEKSKLKQTWAIADRESFARIPVTRSVSGIEGSKFVPTNAVKPGYTAAMAASDLLLAGIFGGPGAIAAANSFEPKQLGPRYPLYRGDQVSDGGKLLRGHLSYAMHLYGSQDGTGETEIYVPAGFSSHSAIPTPTDAAISFYYPSLGKLSNVTLVVFHIADFQLSEKEGRVLIGRIGGRGGSNAAYKHSHLEFYKGDTGLPSAGSREALRIDPASVFD